MTKDEIRSQFSWGPVVEVHEVGPYIIIEHRPRIFKNGVGTSKFDTTHSHFHPYVDGKDTNLSASSLESALAIAIAYRVEGINSRAGQYFMKMLGKES